MNPRSRLFAIALLLLALSGAGYIPVNAASAVGWVPDARVPGYLDDTFTPILVADRNRTVHAFASQWVEQGERHRAIFYRKWTLKGGWTRPIDILLAPSGDAEILSAYLDPSDRMHMLVQFDINMFRAVYYTSAPAVNAESALAWSSPVMIGGPLATSSAAIAGDGEGRLMVIYSGNDDGNGVYFTRSTDSGESWTRSAPLYLTFDSMLSPYSLRLAAGPDHQVRAAWNIVTSLGVDKLLFFASHDLESGAWNIPVELDRQAEVKDSFGPSFPALVDTGSQIVIMYNNGNPFSERPVGAGRPVQEVLTTSDSGETWNGPSVPFPYHLGRSGEHSLVLDGNATPHAMFVQRIEPDGENGQYVTIGGIWHSVYRAGTWTNPERFTTTYQPHDLHAVVSQGDVLLLLWREDPGVGRHGIWFSYSILDAPALPLVPLSSPAVISPPQPAPTEGFTQATATPVPDGLLEGSSPSAWRTNPGLPIAAAIVPVALVVIGALAAFKILQERRS